MLFRRTTAPANDPMPARDPATERTLRRQVYQLHQRMVDAWLRANDSLAGGTTLETRKAAYDEYADLVGPAYIRQGELAQLVGPYEAADVAQDGQSLAYRLHQARRMGAAVAFAGDATPAGDSDMGF